MIALPPTGLRERIVCCGSRPGRGERGLASAPRWRISATKQIKTGDLACDDADAGVVTIIG